LAHTHTSDLLEELVSQAPDGPVDLDWLLGRLDKRSFGLLLLLVCTENLIRVDAVMESPKLAE
jgi:hypothetical protein